MRPTSAKPTALREDDPWKITSSIFCPRKVFGLCSPRAHRIASATFDLPQPFGPTMQVTPGKTWTSVFSANDLKPWMTICSSRMRSPRFGVYGYHGPTARCKKKPLQEGVRSAAEHKIRGPGSRPFEEAALLVFLARPAGARVIAADLGSGDHARLARRCLSVGAVDFAPAWLRQGRRCRAALGRQVDAPDPHLEELLQDHLFQVIHHLLEHVEGFFLVLR